MNYEQGRRTFLSSIAKATGALLFAAPLRSMAGPFAAPQSWTVGQIMDLFIKEVPGGALQNTVDTLKAGNRGIVVSGIVTTMFATIEVIEQAIALSANFIIAHEPTFYSHQDSTDWLQKDEVYQYKAALLQKHNIAVWRNHDYIHRYRPDGILTGLVSKLGWEKYSAAQSKFSFTIPTTNLKSLIADVKEKLGINTVRYIGDLLQPASKVLLLPGAAGGRMQIPAIGAAKPDVVLCGEISEWETAEYIRDARARGQQIALVVLGHNDSEDPGSLFMIKWLQEKVRGVKATHVSSKNPLSFL
jgi:putative NIF3 family GTP cyclohydrolase 1 type 2